MGAFTWRLSAAFPAVLWRAFSEQAGSRGSSTWCRPEEMGSYGTTASSCEESKGTRRAHPKSLDLGSIGRHKAEETRSQERSQGLIHLSTEEPTTAVESTGEKMTRKLKNRNWFAQPRASLVRKCARWPPKELPRLSRR